MSNTLIIAPHTDDEVLSAASFLESTEDLIHTTIFYQTENHPHFATKVLVKESNDLVKFLGCTKLVSDIKEKDDRLDTVPIRDLINEYESILIKLQPSTVLIPNPSYNQDHRIVYDAMLTALRPHDRIPFVKRVLVYEEPETFGTLRNVNSFKAQYFRRVDIDRKIKLVHFYKSQIRDHRSMDHIRAIAQVRGMQCNFDFAEAFEILRWVV